MNRLISKAAAVVVTAALATLLFAFWGGHEKTTSLARQPQIKHDVAKTAAKPAPILPVELATAIEQRVIQAEFTGNGREKIRASIANKTAQPLRVRIAIGQTFERGNNLVIVVRGCDIELRPQATAQATLVTAAVNSANKVVEESYSLSTTSTPKIEPLIIWLQQHPEVSISVIQTTVLALTENLPVSAFAKFARIDGDLGSQFDTTPFHVETTEIISALIALREIGVPDSQLALTIDPQLKVEAMIDPLAHASALRYYNIAPEAEWAFWKNELLQGNPSTRHYALYGIARFYPDIALQMLPKWVRETKTTSVFRMSAVQALAETRRPEAIPVLRELEYEVGFQTELGKAAHVAAEYLDKHLNKDIATKTRVGFRTSQNLPLPKNGSQPAVIALAN